MNITDKQRAHARRHATQDAPAYAKGRTVTPEKVSNHAEYQATISGAPKTEPARTQWKEIYRDTMTAYMINAQHFSPEHEQQERIRLDEGAAQHTSRIAAAVAKMQEPMIVDGQEWETTVPKGSGATQMNTAQTTIRAGKDEYGRSNIYAIWQTAGTWYSAQIWQGQRGQPLDQGEPINVQEHATRKEALARRRQLAQGEEPAPPEPKVQVTKDGPAYLLPGIEPVGQERGEATQTAMF